MLCLCFILYFKDHGLAWSIVEFLGGNRCSRFCHNLKVNDVKTPSVGSVESERQDLIVVRAGEDTNAQGN